MLAIENLLWTSLILATMCFVLELLFRDSSQLNSPFDRLAESPERAGRFAWLVAGFVVVCVTALPTLIVAGQVLVLVRQVGGQRCESVGEIEAEREPRLGDLNRHPEEIDLLTQTAYDPASRRSGFSLTHLGETSG